MTDSASSLMAIIFGLGVFAVIVAVGWRSVQNRRILRMQGANGQETIIVAGEDDDVSSIVTNTETTEPAPAAAPSVVVVNTGVAAPMPNTDVDHGAFKRPETADAEANVSGRDRLSRVVASTK